MYKLREMNEPETTRDRLLSVGLQMLGEGGARSLTVRGLVQRAGENPGTFVYHFKTRSAFLQTLLEQWYAPLFRGVCLSVEAGAPPMVSLKASMEHALSFVHEHAPLIAQLMADYAAGEREVAVFARTVPMRHPRMILDAIGEALREGCLVDAEPENLLMYLFGAVGMPVILSRFLLGDMRPASALLDKIGRIALEPEASRLRLAWALRGIQRNQSA